MIRRNTWILLVLLIAVVGFAVYWNKHKAQLAASATPTSSAGSQSPLFSGVEGSPTGIKIVDSTGKSVEFARNDTGTWVLKAPTAAAADQAAAEAAATQLTSLRVLAGVQLGLDIVGLDKPSYIFTLSYAGGKTHTLKVGALTPIQDGYYASLDSGPIKIVDKQGLDALTVLMTAPPYASTPTPIPSPTVAAPTEATPTVGTGTPSEPSTPGIPAAPSSTPTP